MTDPLGSVASNVQVVVDVNDPVGTFTFTTDGLGLISDSVLIADSSAYTLTYIDCGNQTVSLPLVYGLFPEEIDLVLNNYCEDSICAVVFTHTNTVDTLTGMVATQFFDSWANTNSTWVWDIEGTVSTSMQPTYTFQAMGGYAACVTATNAAGCVSTFCDSIYFMGAPFTDAEYITTVPNPNDSLTFDFTPVLNDLNFATSLTWDLGDGMIYNSFAVNNHTYPAAGTYNTCLTVNFGNCSGASCQNVFPVGAGPDPCEADFYYEIDPDLGHVIVDRSTGDVDSWRWSIDGNVVSTDQFPVFDLSGAASNLCLTVTNNTGCEDDTCSLITPNDLGSLDAHFGCFSAFSSLFDAADPFNVMLGNLALSDSIIGYRWDFGDGTISHEQYPTHTYTSCEQYTVCLTVYGLNGCTETYCRVLGVDESGSWVGKACNWTINVVDKTTFDNQTLSTNIPTHKATELYPNPFANNVFISNATKGTHIRVMNLAGQVIINKTINNHTTNFSLSTERLERGTYFIELNNGEQIQVKKMVKM